jgi:A/G-specific adenine glycosylase
LPTIATLANASSEKIHKLWEGLGYYTRVRNMQRAAQCIVSEHGGKFPTQFDVVLSLPGIGRYTAGAICSIAFNAPTPILDGNVIRVLTRVFGIRDNAREKKTNAKLWTLAEQFVRAAAELPIANSRWPRGNCSALNQSLMELGALICTPKNPQCDTCPLSRKCIARRENCAEILPNLGERVAATPRRFAAVVVEKHGRLIVRRRPAGIVNAQLWEFPNVEVPLKSSAKIIRTALENELGCATEKLVPLGTINHTITRYRIALEVFRAELNGAAPRAECGHWKTSSEIAQLPFTSAHGRIAKMWLGVAGGDS